MKIAGDRFHARITGDHSSIHGKIESRLIVGPELLRAGADDLSERDAAAREKLAAALETARETQQRMREQLVEGAQATDRAIRKHPYEAIGIALGLGLLIGVVATRR